MDLLSFARSVLRWVRQALVDDGAAVPERVVGRWVADRVLRGAAGVLPNLYCQAYRAAERELGEALSRLRPGLSLDDMGVHFARERLFEQLFDPYADAVRTAEQLGRGHTLTRELQIVTQWSKEIDLSTRLAMDTEAGARRPPLGGADDLLPIHQYVLTRSRVDALYAHAKLLADMVMEPMFADPSSEESFSVMTLHVCVLALSQLHPGVRDGEGVLVPFPLECARVAAQVRCVARWVRAADQWCAPTGWGARELESVVRLYMSTWVPHVVSALSTRARSTGAHVPLTDAIFERATCSQMLLNHPPVPPSVRALCLWVGGKLLLSCCSATLQMRLPDGTSGALADWDFVSQAVSVSGTVLELDQFSITVSVRIPLSGLRRVSELLLELL
ncbi:hypothetical protein STCU_05875 [Strigomonas culicis]|uniref:VPS9 domain-containing protein n=1 Tax=Strigomonas culicis TaxID=28005 RepID=S9VV96_9TRYP|nr:hypothetical protein STCU_05875 [Strigomonas culicis]|eukprot:EPY27190.1 hypothetical protein STCU_05875 [Strigomonas culicis]